MITDIKRELKEKGFILKSDGKTYVRDNERIHWCTSGCNTNFVHYKGLQPIKNLSGKAYNLISNYVYSLEREPEYND